MSRTTVGSEEAPDGPSISVVIAVRNGAPTLQRCLDSVFGQTFGPVELVVIDGASDDGTVAVLERNSSRIAYWESERDRGICHAWNKALAHTHGDWIIFIGADDRFRDFDVLRRVADILNGAEGRYRVVYGVVHVVDVEGAILLTEGRPWNEVRDRLCEGMVIPHQSTFHHRSLFERYGEFSERFRISGDYEMLLRELLDNDPLFMPGLVVAEMGAGGVSNRPESAVTIVRETERARYMHGLTNVPERRSLRVVRAVIRAWVTRTFGQRVADAVRDAYHVMARRPR